MSNLTRYEPKPPAKRESLRDIERRLEISYAAQHAMGMNHAYAARIMTDVSRTISHFSDNNDEVVVNAHRAIKEQLFEALQTATLETDTAIAEIMVRRLR